ARDRVSHARDAHGDVGVLGGAVAELPLAVGTPARHAAVGVHRADVVETGSDAAHPAEVRYLLRDVDVVLGLAAVTQRAEGVLAPAPGHVALGHRAGERRPDGEGRDRPEALDELRSEDRVVRTVAELPRGVGSPAVQGADRAEGARVGGAAGDGDGTGQVGDVAGRVRAVVVARAELAVEAVAPALDGAVRSTDGTGVVGAGTDGDHVADVDDRG